MHGAGRRRVESNGSDLTLLSHACCCHTHTVICTLAAATHSLLPLHTRCCHMATAATRSLSPHLFPHASHCMWCSAALLASTRCCTTLASAHACCCHVLPHACCCRTLAAAHTRAVAERLLLPRICCRHPHLFAASRLKPCCTQCAGEVAICIVCMCRFALVLCACVRESGTAAHCDMLHMCV